MKKSAKKEAMINKFAGTVGHAAGTVAKATQDLAASAAALVKPITRDRTRRDAGPHGLLGGNPGVRVPLDPTPVQRRKAKARNPQCDDPGNTLRRH
jgi:hypothetical protein